MAVTVTAVILAVILSAVSSPMRVVADNSAPPPYVNHTVGGAAGWIFKVSSNISAVNFSDWATSQSFFLGDHLIFKTGTALPVIQTYNVTTYARCNADDDNGNETYVYDGSASDASPAVIPVPLTVEGDNYYFSGAGDDGFQCSHGMRFHIVVQHGRGLPPSLSQPPPPPYTEPPSPPATPAPPGGGTTPQEESFHNGGRRRGVGVWVKFLGFFFGALLLMV